MGASTAAASPAAAEATEPTSEDYSGFFGRRRRDRDFRAHVERALADDLLSRDEESALVAWAEAQGIRPEDWRKRFGDLVDRMLIAGVNDGRLPDVRADRVPMIVKSGEHVHFAAAASLMKEVVEREFRGGSTGISFRVVKGVRFHTGAFRGRSVVVGTSLQVADQGTLVVTSRRTVFVGQRKTLELPNDKLVNLNVFTDGISFNLSNRQSVPLFRVPNGQVVAAIVNAAIQQRM